MDLPLLSEEVFGLTKTIIDVHTLGMSMISNLLKGCGYQVRIAPQEVMEAITYIRKVNNFSLLKKWIIENHISRLGFSYRLDPNDAKNYFCELYYQLKSNLLFVEEGGPLRRLFFAGLPDSCKLIEQELNQRILCFPGDETPYTSLTKLGVPLSKLPKDLNPENNYDRMRWEFAVRLITKGEYKNTRPFDHQGYTSYGTDQDSYIDRLEYAFKKKTLPLIRAHVGPYNPDRQEALKEFISWEKQLVQAGFLDVLSIGTSQLTQSNFGEVWDNLPNGGGVPVNSELEYRQIKEAAKPMLVRTYAGTKNVPALAKIHERCLNISWHALSFWWFCEIDGRGKNTVSENLKEHLETIKYIVSTGKPLEINIPHHFAFRGADDITFIISAYLAAKTAKKLGIRHLILQDMLNTPKYTWGIQDLAKGRVMLKLVRELEDTDFKVSLQTRAGLDYFSPNIEKAKIQLAAVTALMDDIEPENENSPEIIHVVSYSEAIRLATPEVINESIQITLSALKEYRQLRRKGQIENMVYNKELHFRVVEMYDETREAIQILERHIPNLYTADGLYFLFKEGFFPVPYLLDEENKYRNATDYTTALRNGGIRVVDEKGNIIRTGQRYGEILNRL